MLSYYVSKNSNRIVSPRNCVEWRLL